MPLAETRGLTLVGVALTNLDDENVQPMLPFCGEDDGDALDRALDAVRDRFGSKAVTRAALIGRELSPSVPLLPDDP